MPKKPRVRTLMNSKYVKVSETLHKSAPQYFGYIFWSLCTEICSKNFVSVVSEICKLFVKILTPNDKYSVLVKASVWRNQFKCYYLITKKYFLQFFLHFRNLHKIWNNLKKTWPSEVICFWNYRLEKADLFICPKSRVSEHLRTVNMLKGSKHCRNLHSSIFVIFFDHSEKKISSNNSFLVVFEIFRVFVNILTPNEKYSPSVKASV